MTLPCGGLHDDFQMEHCMTLPCGGLHDDFLMEHCMTLPCGGLHDDFLMEHCLTHTCLNPAAMVECHDSLQFAELCDYFGRRGRVDF